MCASKENHVAEGKHMHVYLEFTPRLHTTKWIDGVNLAFGRGCHIRRIDYPTAAIKYTKKDGDFFEEGHVIK